MIQNLKTEKLASNQTEAQIRANELSKTQVSSVKTRKAVDVSCQKFFVKSAEYLKRYAYLHRSYNTCTYYDIHDNITTEANAYYVIVNTKTKLSKEICEALVLDILINRYLQTKINCFVSNSYIITTSENEGSAYGDTIRTSLDTYIKNKAIVQVDKAYMHEHNLSTDMSKYYNKLNLNSAIVKTRLEQLRKENSMFSQLKEQLKTVQ